MGFEVGQIDLGLDINQKSFNKQLSGIAGGAEKSVMSAFKPLGKFIGAALGTAAFVSFTKSCIGLGSDLAEVQNVVDTTFTTMNESVNEFARNAMEQFGLSETVTKKYMGALGTMSKSMGFSEQAAYSMAESVTGLAGDVASFYNISSDEAYTKLKSIWTGETETLKELGVLLTQTNLDQYALNNGFGKTTANMTEQEKVMLRYQYTLSALGAAQGDFARTSDGWANQVRVLSLRFDSLKATLGQGFINLFTPIIQAVNNLIIRLQVLADGFKSFTEMLTGSSYGGTSGVASIATDAQNAIDGLSGVESGAKAAKKALSAMSIDELNVVQEDSGGSGGASVGAADTSGLATVTGGVVSEIDKTSESMKRLMDNLSVSLGPTIESFNNFKQALDPLKTFAAKGLSDFYNNLLKPLAKYALGEKGLQRLLNILTSFITNVKWSKLNESLSAFWTQLEKLIEFKFDTLMDFYEMCLKPVAEWTMNDGLPSFISTLSSGFENIDLEPIRVGLNNLWAEVSKFTITIGEGLLWLWENVLVPFGTWAGNEIVPLFFEGLGNAIRLLNGVIEALAPLATWLFDNFLLPIAEWTGGVVVSILDGIVAALGGISDWISNNQAAVQGITISIGAFFAAWKIATLIEFVSAAGGVTSAVTSMKVAISTLTLAKIKDKAETLAIAALYVKDFIVNMAKGTAALITQTAQFALTTGAKIADTAATTAATAATWLFNAALAVLTSPITLVIAAIAGLIAIGVLLYKNWDTVRAKAIEIWTSLKEKICEILTAIGNFFSSIWESIKNATSTVFNGVKTVIITVMDGIKTGVKTALDWIKDKFVTIFTSIKDTVTGIFSGMWNGIKGVINSILGGIEGMANGVVRGINKVVSAMNNLSFDIPDWIPGMGGKTFGFNIPTLSEINIPKLAEGGYVKANEPQLAMIGDNKRHGEIVAPEDKLLEITKRAAELANSGNTERLYEYLETVIVLLRELISAVFGLDISTEISGRDLLTLIKNETKRSGYSMSE